MSGEEELLGILDRRSARYAEADAEVDTTGRSIEASKAAAVAAMATMGVLNPSPAP